MEAPAGPSYKEIEEKIKGWGADEVSVVRRGYKMYVAYKRYGRGCGRIHNRVRDYLARRFKDLRIIILRSPKPNSWCHEALVRQPGTEHFVLTKLWVREAVLDF